MAALPTRHLLSQGRVLAALGGTVAEAARQRLGFARSAGAPELPGPEVSARVPAPGLALQRDFIRHVGGDPSAWKSQIPPHLFPQWAVPLAARTLRGLPYPMLKVINGGCRLEMRAPLPADAPLMIKARLEAIEDDGRRAVLRQRVVTGTDAVPEALIADLFVIVPVAAQERNGAGKPAKKPQPRVPETARALAAWKLGPQAGLAFGMLTGDLNPIHWVRPYARAAGFSRPILHGFSTMARAMEGLIRNLFAGSVARLGSIDVRFTRPLVLPARVGLYVQGQELYVGDAPGGPAYLTGGFSERTIA